MSNTDIMFLNNRMAVLIIRMGNFLKNVRL